MNIRKKSKEVYEESKAKNLKYKMNKVEKKVEDITDRIADGKWDYPEKMPPEHEIREVMEEAISIAACLLRYEDYFKELGEKYPHFAEAKYYFVDALYNASDADRIEWDVEMTALDAEADWISLMQDPDYNGE